MNNQAYPKWVGVVLGFLLNGSAHFLAGDKRSGISWYLGISLTGVAALLVLVLPGVITFLAALLLMLIALFLWLLMLKQSYRTVPRIRIRGWVAVIAVALLLNSAWQYGIGLIMHPFRIPTAAMAPTILPGDYVIAERVTYRFTEPKRGDIVVFSTSGLDYPAVKPDTFYIKRIAGLPGETVQIGPPFLLVDGTAVTNPPVFADISAQTNGFLLADTSSNLPAALSGTEDKMLLGEHQYLTLGDNTTSSLDGRYYGPISRDQIYGRVSRTYWPLSRIGK